MAASYKKSGKPWQHPGNRPKKLPLPLLLACARRGQRCDKVSAKISEELQHNPVAPTESDLRLIFSATATKAETEGIVLFMHEASVFPSEITGSNPFLSELRSQ
mmetsp:Transcript_56826/g.176226  ORF Transcript_56826/g.176226 Transcript_56826/m.176226 type:complete len:104 (+) Transcript_56826:528-839(+)